jgi:phosphatidylserine/phosphatidylglycerophosphate/cardiolipin synthase-like enzyme
VRVLEPSLTPLSLHPPEFTINEARALFDGDAYREMVALAGRAERSVRVEFFLFGGPVADAMIGVLAGKMAQGVEVRVTLDRARGMLPQVRRECRATHRQLLAERIDVVLSDPRPLPNSPGRPAMAHNKILVVDDREALVGGMNVGSLFFRHHDVMIHLQGPAAAALGRQFDHDRQFALDPRCPRLAGSPPLPHFPESGETAALRPGESWARILGTGVGRRTTRQAIVRNLRAARSSVCITMSEIGRTGILDEVIAAKERGVAVRVLVDPQDMQEYLPPALGPLRQRCPKLVLNALAIRILLEAGIPVRLFEVGKEFALLHMKMVVFDAKSAIVGSTNWARGGFEWVGETDVELRGGWVIDELLAQFEVDWDRSAPAAVPPRFVQLLCRLYERLVQQGPTA